MLLGLQDEGAAAAMQQAAARQSYEQTVTVRLQLLTIHALSITMQHKAVTGRVVIVICTLPFL